MRNREFKDLVFREMAAIGKATSDPKRLEILDILTQGAKNVEMIASAIGMSMAAASHHLQILREARLAKVKRQGKYAFYEATSEGLHLWACLLRAGESASATVKEAAREFFSGQESVSLLELPELLNRLQEPDTDIILLDVRPEDEYAAGHFPGAVSVPLKQLEEQLCRLPANKQIVAYCRGKYCVMSKDAVSLLRACGYRAMRLEEGILEGKDRGLLSVTPLTKEN